jgi:hypothetical protein
MMRRIAFLAHGVGDTPYQHDILTDADVLNRDFAKDNLVQLIAVLEDIATSSDDEFEFRYPELMAGSSAISATEARDLHRRWADQALAVLRNYPVPSGLL